MSSSRRFGGHQFDVRWCFGIQSEACEAALSAEQIAGARTPGKASGEIRWHGSQRGKIKLADREVKVRRPRLRHTMRSCSGPTVNCWLSDWVICCSSQFEGHCDIQRLLRGRLAEHLLQFPI
ncbi:MAG TPA: hypothetical protein VH639_29695 [Bryobacteraceae bacterium]